MAGWSHDPNKSTTRTTLWNAEGEASFVPTPNPAGQSFGNSINNHGAVVSSYHTDDYPGYGHAFISGGSTVVDLNDLFLDGPAQYSVAHEINDHGQVVGVVYDACL